MEMTEYCNDGCVLVECGLQGNSDILGCTDDEIEECYGDRRDIADQFSDKIKHLKCFQDAVIGYDYGHINYAVASYCVKNGHISCLRYLHQINNMLKWHNDIAEVAIENNQLECLKYILYFMGNFLIKSENISVFNECTEFLSINKEFLDKQFFKRL